MSELTSPLQPFIVRQSGVLSELEQRSLFQLYQPIIGHRAVNLYLLLLQQPVNEQKLSQRKVHSYLFPYIEGALGTIDEARLKLEAVGLLQTYKEARTGVVHPTLLYDMQYPLLLHDFVENAYLCNALINQLGDLQFFEILKQWEIPDIEAAEFEEVSVSFETIFSKSNTDYYSQIDEMLKGRTVQQHSTNGPQRQASEHFDYAFFLRKLMAAHMDHSVFDYRFKQEMLALHTIYNYDENELAVLVLKHYHAKDTQIDYDQLRIEATTKPQPLPVATESTNVKPVHTQEAPIKEEADKRSAIQQAFPSLQDKEIEIVLLCERVTPLAMLTQIKRDKNGFVSAQEQMYIQNIAQLTSLPQSVQSFLVFYLLMIRNRTDFQKGESERVANEWQQQHLDSPAKVLNYIHQQAKVKQMRQKNTAKKQPYRTQQPKQKEPQPYWMKQQVATEKQNLKTSETTKSEAQLRNQLGQLFNEGGSEQ
ncbi:hypothetical protein [Tuanshanicoccus lijuaniae]|uniref:hypothetical protein n=1 Tax=Aerococcaceae bacterium zg-1292 TaxID=2774330 RepID=UPI001BD85FA5|nr:hypothetical protein [Aerococcaceae bacterium zg-A91]MBS4458660.1 hypothetical protein [Aerococcaceae bacterium zg-BR33]